MTGAVLVPVKHVGVRVRVLVDEVHRTQQRAVGKHVVRSSFGNEPVLLAEDHTTIGE